MSLGSTLKFIVTHPMGSQQPVGSLWRFIAWQIRSRLREEVVFDWIGDAKLVVRKGMTGATGNIYVGLHEYVDMSFVLHILRPGDVFADVGANVGSYTILASKVCGADVVSIEPDPTTVVSLKKNVEINSVNDRVRIEQTAVGDRSGTIEFTVGRDTTNQVATDLSDAETYARTQTVPLRKLDDLFDQVCPRVMKIDVEGFELEAFSGANTVLADRQLCAIISEATDVDVVQFLRSYGFERVYYDPTSRVLSANASRFASHNGIFVRTDCVDLVMDVTKNAGDVSIWGLTI